MPPVGDRDYRLSVGIEERLPPAMVLGYALQHLVALTGIWIFPVLIGQELSLSKAQVGLIVQACFITTGLVTILQSGRLLRLPVVQGPTAVFFVVLVSGARTYGLGAAFGSMAVAGLLFAALSLPIRRWGLIGYLSPLMSPPLIYGMLLVIIGVQLAGIGLPNWFGVSGPPSLNFGAAMATALVILACMIFGGASVVRRAALLIGILVGSLFYTASQGIDLSEVGASPMIRLPSLLPFGFGVSWALVPLMLLAYAQAAADAMGIYSLLSRWGGQTLTKDRVSRGIFGEVLGSAVGATFGGLGTTSYAENIGIIRVSGIGSRRVTLAAGCFALAVGFIPKIGVLIACMPSPVLSAASTLLFGVIAVSGIQIMKNVVWDEMNTAVAGVSLILCLGLAALPDRILSGASPALRSLAAQPMLTGIILLVVLNGLINGVIRRMILPADPKDAP